MTGDLDQDGSPHGQAHSSSSSSSPYSFSSSSLSTPTHNDKHASPDQETVTIVRHTSRDRVSFGLDTDAEGFSSDEPQPKESRIRWAILGAACLVLFGNYYAFDNPAALNQPLQEYMGMSNDTYAYFLNILYTSYSLPNIVLPWLGGYASDIFGHRRLLIFLSSIVAFGHFVVCLGVERKSVPMMVLGRVLFGAGESLAVAQSAITVKYFQGKELAMALGINLCIARLGSVLNDILTPYIWSRSNVPSAFWGGFVSCILSFMTACLLAWLDRRYESEVASGFSRVPTHPTDGRFSLEVLDTGAASTNVHRYDPPTAAANKSRRATTSAEVIGMESLGSKRPMGVDGLEEGGITSSDDSEDSSRESVDHRNSQDLIVRDRVSSRTSIRSRNRTDGNGNGSSSSARANCLRILKPVCDYSQSAWVFFLMTLLMVGVQVPFNSIHAGFLQMRWYHNDPQKAAQIMTVPDLFSAILVLPVGYFVDHYGQKTWLFMLCGLIIGSSHFVLGIIPVPSPVPALVALGIASAIGAIFTSAIPVLVKPHQIATA
ncbi:hypothetical protein KI688_001350 [Linnemannia hyalina]|uniref:Lysosomal dipeptide transporter MFSD1 n=1 Tax=Linnemannia hyalina TaxID=64524 RepID=A0A9P8BSK3_9FUNG|nr:hypothetical protein KI688_001350 [Linnemannia hyalina]